MSFCVNTEHLLIPGIRISRYHILSLFCIFLIFVGSCRKEDNIPPLILTLSAKEITDTSAVTGGLILRERSIPVTERGIVWSTEPDPDLNSNTGRINEGSGEGKFTINLGDLFPETTYYVRAYAINSNWTIYGETISFRTFGKLILPCEECEDTGIIPPQCL